MDVMSNWTPAHIKRLRQRFGLSQQRLGHLTGVTQNYIHLLEKGVKQPSRTLQLLLDYLESDLQAQAGAGTREGSDHGKN